MRASGESSHRGRKKTVSGPRTASRVSATPTSAMRTCCSMCTHCRYLSPMWSIGETIASTTTTTPPTKSGTRVQGARSRRPRARSRCQPCRKNASASRPPSSTSGWNDQARQRRPPSRRGGRAAHEARLAERRERLSRRELTGADRALHVHVPDAGDVSARPVDRPDGAKRVPAEAGHAAHAKGGSERATRPLLRRPVRLDHLARVERVGADVRGDPCQDCVTAIERGEPPSARRRPLPTGTCRGRRGSRRAVCCRTARARVSRARSPAR